VALGAVESRCLTGVIPKQRAPWGVRTAPTSADLQDSSNFELHRSTASARYAEINRKMGFFFAVVAQCSTLSSIAGSLRISGAHHASPGRKCRSIPVALSLVNWGHDPLEKVAVRWPDLDRFSCQQHHWADGHARRRRASAAGRRGPRWVSRRSRVWHAAPTRARPGGQVMMEDRFADFCEFGDGLVDRLKATKIHHLKELRPGSRGRSETRIILRLRPRPVSAAASGR